MENSTQAVRAWEEPVHIPTYPALAPDKNPMFLDKRVYQGSSGKVYPNPFTDRISDEKIDHIYRGVFLENEYVRLMILPEIGGRIHIGQDRTTGYDFFYRQNVIKPALVGLLGPWISGGVEFNWPQHHRPTTFMPVDHCIEEHEDGSRTVWLSEHEPMNRMKGMVGICLHPGKSIVEAKVRLYNRTPFVQTFLWWANVAVRVHDRYQSFFPPDVTYVADHARRAVSSFPVARNFYYGVDYRSGVDLTWYKNIPVPTSYMVVDSACDFFGGYDHAANAGVMHVANRFIAPGKKQWTWGNAEFGYAWDRELTEADGPYIELMAGAYTDNQPDFSFLQPYETKTFSQFWYPIQKIGPAKSANRLFAINLEQGEEGWRVGVCATEPLEQLQILLTARDEVLLTRQVNISPGSPFVELVAPRPELAEAGLLLRVLDRHSTELIRYAASHQSGNTQQPKLPQPATEPPPPREIVTVEELYLTGLHLEQYRHATREPALYWREGVARDPQNARCNNVLGLLALRQGKFVDAENHFRTAVQRLTFRNPNPYDGEPFYNLGLALTYQNKSDEAYRAFYKAAWNYQWQTAAYYELGAIDCARGNFVDALAHLEGSLRTNTDHLKARNLKTAILRLHGKIDEAHVVAEGTIALDPLDLFSRYEIFLLTGKDLLLLFHGESQTFLDVAFDYAHAGLTKEADDLLGLCLQTAKTSQQMVWYTRGYLAAQRGDSNSAAGFYKNGREACPDYCFPSRLEEMIVLEGALRHDPGDARAHYYLGNFLYDKRRREEAIYHWEEAAKAEPTFSIPWRNLGIAYYNVRGDLNRALESYERAFEVNPRDARLLYELDQLRKRTGGGPEQRLRDLEKHAPLVDQRDDLTVELVTLYNETGQHEKALSVLCNRRFHPWEGGEGLVSGQYVAAHLFLGRDALDRGEGEKALTHFRAAREYPHNLGEGKHLLTQETHLDYFTGVALAMLHRGEEAKASWEKAPATNDDLTIFAYYRALAFRSLREERVATSLLQRLRKAAERQETAEVKIDYFATSLPNFLIFEDDLQKRNKVDSLFLRAMANLGLGEESDAIAGLRQVVHLDKNHLYALAELQRLKALRPEQQVAQR